MSDQKEVLSLRIIAARCISDDEQDGLAEINRITADIYGLINWKFTVLFSAFTIMLLFTAILLLSGVSLVFAGVKGGEIVTAIGLIPFALLLAVLGYWRIFQYGGMTVNTPQKALYGDPDDPAVRNLERLFSVLQLESTPRAFYITRNGRRRHIDERYFFGSLRAAHVARDRSLRDVLFAPAGFWFSRELFMEVDVATLIAQINAKPNRRRTKDLRLYRCSDVAHRTPSHPGYRRRNQARRADADHQSAGGLVS